ncbi:SDR family oxidoreductase [Pseudaminobacter soli (ex Li et al. 2025)]|uniref:Oxidoreductase n=1 Tax=Pseudaminobacter soli (ex Li et al. 2025) TaxID=1295366 RepID=A0A2P7SMK8_9HYPH|nr:SDR family oxidoreductase [Mesorhizobium soli]PSJ63734.1 oxidoreductase [Mesorhizobium soli]
MRVLILGGNGFIGSSVARALACRGHAVTALARNRGVGARRMPELAWQEADIARLRTPSHWQPLLAQVDAVVNCAGALQDGARDDVVAVQEVAMQALYRAAAGSQVRLIVQISARTDGGAADTAFLASKRNADAALKASGMPFVILRPAIVIGRDAHGGSALLRALAAVPLATPLVHGGTPMQFAALDDVSECVCRALDGRLAAGTDLDIAAPEVLTLAQTVDRHRQWLGVPPRTAIAVSEIIARPVARAADLLGHLGWRSPLRSTAMAAAAGGVTAPEPNELPELRFKSLDETLRDAPGGVQDLWFARLYLLKPVIFGTSSLFWLLSGIIALLRFEASAAHLVDAGLSTAAATILTVLTSLADIALGVGVIVRRYAGPALKGMVALSLAYLAAATLLSPTLWADPLGPLVKVLPSIVLALVALAILDER